jgi:hypothetical protein
MKKDSNKEISPALLVDSPMKLMIQILVFCSGSSLFAYFFYPYFTAISFHQLDKFTIQTTQVETNFQLHTLFVSAFGMIPILVFTVVKFLKVQARIQKIAIVISIFLAGIIFWQFQLYNLQTQFSQFIQSKISVPIKYSFARESLFLEFNFLIGLIIGAILAAILLRIYMRKNKY